WWERGPRMLWIEPTRSISGLPRRFPTHMVVSLPAATLTGPQLTDTEPGATGASSVPPPSSPGLPPSLPGVDDPEPQAARARPKIEASARGRRSRTIGPPTNRRRRISGGLELVFAEEPA